MRRVAEVIEFLERRAPRELAESWDNVGLLWGDAQRETLQVMTCLTLTPDVAVEAVQRGVGLIVTHHPILFRPVQRVTAGTAEGRMLLELAAARVAVYSPHTSYDSAARGINQQLAESLGLTDIRPLRPLPTSTAAQSALPDDSPLDATVGAGRHGTLPVPLPLADWLDHVKGRLHVKHLQFVGDLQQEIRRAGIACGSAAEFLNDARRLDCQALLTGEARFHDCLAARATDTALVLVGHYSSERPAVEHLATMLGEAFPALTVWASETERDPLQWL